MASTDKSFTVKASSYLIEFNKSALGLVTANAKRRLTRKDKKAGITVDTEKVVIAVSYSIPDEYHVSNMMITLYDEMAEKDLIEFFTMVETCIESDYIVFTRISSDYMKGDTELGKALAEFGYVQDQNDPEYYEAERKLISNTALFLMLGMCTGMAIGLSAKIGTILGECIGMGIGVVIGAGLDASARKARKELKERRGVSITTTLDEDGEPVFEEDEEE